MQLHGHQACAGASRSNQIYDRDAAHLHIVRFSSHQEQFLTALKERCNGRSPLNLRKPLEKDGVTPDLYFRAAPGQSTLGYSVAAGGVKPEIKMAPTQICEHVIAAAAAVPFIQSVKLYIIKANGEKQHVDLDYVKALNMQIKDVPNLYNLTPSPVRRIPSRPSRPRSSSCWASSTV
jgi:hypothetical protein